MRLLGKKILCVLLSVLCILSLVACGEKKVVNKEDDNRDKIQIGITFDSFVIERWQRERDIFAAAAEELGAELNVQNANGDIKEQINQIDYFIEKGMDVIVLIQVADDTQNLVEAIERAHRAGIKVIAYDRLVLNANVDLYISFDNVEVGRLMGEHMASHLAESAKVIQICGPLSDNNVTLVMNGFDEMAKAHDMDIRLTDHAEGWLAERAFDITSAYLSKNVAPDGIMCGNDSLAGNAVKALSESRLAGEVCVVGQDADLEACQRIVEGTQCMTVYKPVEKLARRAAELAVALAKGESLDDVKDTVNDGKFDVPYEALEPIAVTAENMDEVITGKYHEEADIYLNVRE